MKTAPYLHKANSEAFIPVSHNILHSLLKGQNKTCVLSLVFNGYLLCTDRPGHVLGVLGPHTHRHTQRGNVRWGCIFRNWEKEISVERGETSQRRQKASWALADSESIHICEMGDDSISLVEEARSCKTLTLQAMQWHHQPKFLASKKKRESIYQHLQVQLQKKASCQEAN